VGGSVVEIEVVFLDVFAVIPLAVGQTEQALFENGIDTVPESHGEAQALLIIGDACQPVFSPVVGAGSRLLVREIIPRGSGGTVILADRTPLALAQVRSTLSPGEGGIAGFPEPLLLR